MILVIYSLTTNQTLAKITSLFENLDDSQID